MNRLSRQRAALGLLSLLLGGTAAQGQALLNQVTLVPDASVAANPIKAAQPFTITTAGSYTVTLTDLVEPSALGSLRVAIATATSTLQTVSLPTLNGTVTTSTQSANVTLQPGSYFAQVIASAASGALGGTFSVVVAPMGGGTDALSYHDVVAAANPAPTSGESVLQAQFTVTQQGNYTLTATDQHFPVALNAAPTILVFNDCGSPPAQNCTVMEYFAGPGSMVLPMGIYDLYSFAQANQVTAGGPYAGLYSIGIAITGNGSPATAYAATVPVGQLPAANPFTIPGAGTVSLSLNDVSAGLALPLVKPLGSIEAIVTQGPNVLLPTASGVSNGTPYSFPVTVPGQAQLYVFATPNAMTGQSGWAAYLTEQPNVGVQSTLADIAEPVVDGSHFGYGFQTPMLTAGTYTLAVHDFGVPAALMAQDSLVLQQGQVLKSIAATNPASVDLPFMATPGVANLLVFPTLQAMNPTEGLFGIAVEPASGPNAFQATQGVGALFTPITLNVPAAGNYGVTFTDLGFPAVFTSVALIGTQGNTEIGAVTPGGAGQGGTFNFMAAAAGNYTLNVLAQVGGMHYGLYGLEAGLVPTATLTPAAMTVGSGQNVLLSWNSTNATTCTASGAALWSGPEPLSGSMFNAGTIMQDTTYNLSCTGPGGPMLTPASVTVDYSASSSSSGGGSGSGSKSGGGAVSPEMLLAMSVLAGLKLRRRRAMLPG